MLEEMYDGRFINPQMITRFFLIYLKYIFHYTFFSITVNTFNAVLHKDIRKIKYSAALNITRKKYLTFLECKNEECS